jgi:hypothetical protein
MSLILDGSNGLSDVDGTAATPAIRGTDANTGIFFPAADTIAFSEGGAESMRLTSAGNVGIGTTTPSSTIGFQKVLEVYDPIASTVQVNGGGTYKAEFGIGSNGGWLGTGTNDPMRFVTNNTERMRIDSSGNVLVGTTSSFDSNLYKMELFGGSDRCLLTRVNGTTSRVHIVFQNDNGSIGSIQTSGSSTSFNTTSDYRLKEDIAPMTGALAKVAALKPVTYKWKVDGSDGQGFIAHELAEVVPDCVSGEKDAVDADGKPVHQGVDTSFLVATLTAAIQELKAELDTVKAELATLKA